MRHLRPCILLLSACGTISERPNATQPVPAKTPAATNATRAQAEVATPTARPPATWKGEVIEWTELQPVLSERAGAVCLEEVLLDRQLAKLLSERRLKVEDAAIAAEERELLSGLSDDSARAERLLADLRAVQGLGDRRWKALLRRNASARLLVQDQVKMTPESIDAALDAAHGPKRACRVIALPDLKACAEAKRRLDAGERFGEVAASMSNDRSAERGGLVNPVSRLDPTWPSAFRQTLWALQPGGVSAPVMLDQRYVIVRMESELPADAPQPGDRAAAERDVRRGQERVQMEALVSGLRQSQRDVVIFDESLRDAWTRVRNASR
jgi:foldase protein PrsA